MDIYQVEIIDPGAKKLLEELAKMKLITVQPMDPAKRFAKLVKKIRSAKDRAPSLEEISAEVESVRSARYSRK
jgi:hypothetical protein